MSHLRFRPASTIPSKIGGILAALLTLILLCTCIPTSIAQGDEPPRTARVIYHFVDPDQLSGDVSFAEYESELSSVCAGEIWEDDGHVVIRANAYPQLMEVSTEALVLA